MSISESTEMTDEPVVASNDQSGETNEETNASQTLLEKLCGVCQKETAKYKCTRCLLPYCSVVCSKSHNESHPADEVLPKKAAAPVEEAPSKPGPRPTAGTVAAAGMRGPFAALGDSKELQELFKIYPKLAAELDEINNATLRPQEPTGYEKHGKARKEYENWNADRGLENGVKALNRARNTFGGEGVREFSTLVLQILSGDEGETAATQIEKELAEENTRIIEALLNRER